MEQKSSEQLISHLSTSIEPIIKLAEEFINSEAVEDKKRFNLCLFWPLHTAHKLTMSVINLIHPNNEDVAQRIIASLITRYLFELTSNIGVMLCAESESDRSYYQLEWIKLRELKLNGNASYSVPIDHLSDKRQRKFSSSDFVPIGHEDFIFDDPWNLKMSDKVEFLPISDKQLFLEQWKIYSHISHASSFSIWPKWIQPVPIHDSLQCLSIIMRIVSVFLGRDFDANLFLEDAWKCLGDKKSSKPTSPH